MRELVLDEIRPEAQHLVQDSARHGPKSVAAHLILGNAHAAHGSEDGVVAHRPLAAAGAAFGGAAVLAGIDTGVKQLARVDRATTNNRMELLAIIRGLGAAHTARPVAVYSDSTYALLGEKVINKKFPRSADRDLWVELIAVASRRSAPITGYKVKAHSGITARAE